MRIKYLLYLTVILIYFSSLSLQAQDSIEGPSEQASEIDLLPDTVSAPALPEQINGQEASSKTGEFEVFVPTDEIPEDQSVAFPVDI
jgi:hypothetical protein